jgi:hypothetical protein
LFYLISRYNELGPEGLLTMLVNRKHFGLAKKICEYLDIPSERVMISWACHQVKAINLTLGQNIHG